ASVRSRGQCGGAGAGSDVSKRVRSSVLVEDVRMVEQVEGFGLYLQLELFNDLELTRDPEIDVIERVSKVHVPALPCRPIASSAARISEGAAGETGIHTAGREAADGDKRRRKRLMGRKG